MTGSPDRLGSDEAAGRLIAVLIGASNYPRYPGPLPCAATDIAALHTALVKTQHPDTCLLFVLASDAVETTNERPDREGILRTLEKASSTARAADTVLIYYAGHGMIRGGTPHLVPEQAGFAGLAERLQTVSITEVQECFRDCASRQRLLVLDACQERMDTPAELPSSARASGTVVYARAGATQGFIKGLESGAGEWTVVLSCAPGEEAVEVDGHGIFSRLFTSGLREDADLDRDGVVHLAELVHYLALAVPIEAASFGHSQHPVLVCRGRMDMPLTRPQPGSSALPDNWRVSHPGPAFVPFWRQSLAGDWPYVGFPAGQLGPAGIGVLYAVAVASAAAYFLAAGGQPQWPTLLIAAGTFVVWWMAVAAAVAATRVRWHAGGYATGLALVSWHAMVYVALRTFFPSQDVAADVRLGGLLFADLALIIILGINAWQFILSMLALLSMKERAVVARALTELRRCWVSCRMPNPIAMVSVHPRLSLVLFGGCGTVLLSAVIREEALRPPYTGGGAILVLCYTLLVLIWWSVCWQDAIYRFVRGQLRPDV